MPLRNLPTDTPEQLSSLISVKPGQVSSMSLSGIDDEASLMFFAYAEGESVSEECYPKNVLYYLVEGSVNIVFADHKVCMTPSDIFMVEAGCAHAVEPNGSCKILQIME